MAQPEGGTEMDDEIRCPYKGKCFAEGKLQCRVCDLRPETSRKLTIAENTLTAIATTATIGLLFLSAVVFMA